MVYLVKFVKHGVIVTLLGRQFVKVKPDFSKFNCLAIPEQNFAMAESEQWVLEGVDVKKC